MDSLFLVSTIMLINTTFLLLVGIAFSKDEFEKRSQWRIYKNNHIDWRNVDAGRFLFFLLSKIWLTSFCAFIIAYIGVKYV